MYWRGALVLAYVGLGILFGVVLGGGAVVLVFFAVWGGVWLGFSLFWGWADKARATLLAPRADDTARSAEVGRPDQAPPG